MIVSDPPVCFRCHIQPESLSKLEQHVRTSQSSSDAVTPPARLLDGASSRVSLIDPLNPEANRVVNPDHGPRMLPPWMSLLPSNRQPGALPPKTSPLRRRSTFSDRDMNRNSTPFVTPPQCPTTRTEGNNALRSPSPLSLTSLSGLSKELNREDRRDKSTQEGRQLPGRSPEFTKEGYSQHLRPQPQVLFHRTSEEPKDYAASASKNFLKRRLSGHRAKYQPLRRCSAATVISPSLPVTSPVGSCASTKSNTHVLSQGFSPAKAPFMKELSGFFTSRAEKRKWILPSRVGMSNSGPRADVERKGGGSASSSNARTKLDTTQLHGTSNPRVNGKDPIEVDSARERCGVDMQDWWVRRESRSLYQDEDEDEFADTDAGADGGRRICQSCKAGSTIPGAWE